MKTKNRINTFSIIAIGVLSIFFTSCKKDGTTSKKVPVITWANPADISFGTLLSETQLNAIADVPGTLVYIPTFGIKLDKGTNQDLRVDFTPSDIVNYDTASKTVKINVVALTDIDGNEYNTTTINTQTWMVENLKTTRYKDGTPIPIVTEKTEWAGLNSPGYCWYDNNETAYKNTYGALYNWYSVNTNNLCPSGWHIPKDEEWTTLCESLGGQDIAGGKLKSIGTLENTIGVWYAPNTDATNEIGFSALPGGGRYFNGNSGWMGYYGTYWTSTEASSTGAWTRYVKYNSGGILREAYSKNTGYSVRCIKD
jgi:uncharacterized protein (TIGR02145 family)